MKVLDYHLPDSSIAKYPLEKRSQSKLLVYQKGNISEDTFENISDFLPENSHLFINNTKVIQARIPLQKETGAKIEVLLLEPYNDLGNPYEALHYSDEIYWKALIGGASKFKEGQVLNRFININGRAFPIYFERVKNLDDGFLIKIHWENPNPETFTFAEILPELGHTPIPPYLNRKSEDSDVQRYQTVYAKYEGSVAAPTSSLHYEKEVFEKIKAKNISINELTLHVGAGTFLPIKTEEIEDHHMHAEWIELTKGTLEKIKNILTQGETIIASGTTSARFLESLYWYGVQIKHGIDSQKIEQSFIKEHWDTDLSALESIEIILKNWEENEVEQMALSTDIFIYPPYNYKMAQALITNFHQPQSTLLLLVATLVGDDWEKVYHYALENNFRFLSYGDSSLLIP